ncbi:MAG: ACP S-malonyltransferase [Pseudomonadota bacterium]
MSVAFVFPGQGSQAVGMGRALADNFPAARTVFDEINDALGEDLTAIMWDGDKATLTLTANAQPALMAVSVAASRVLEGELGMALGQTGDAVAGHSLGEYSALAAAGAISLADTARLLRARGLAMQSAVPVGVGAMVALLGGGIDAAEKIAAEARGDDVLQVANDNEPTQVVLSGHKSAADRVPEIAKAHGVRRAMPLPVSAPFHCSLMQPAADVMADALANTLIAEPTAPVVQNVTAEATSDPDAIQKNLVAQVTGTVRWRECVLAMKTAGVTTYVELGAGKVLSGLIRRTDETAETHNLGSPDDIAAVVAALSS